MGGWVQVSLGSFLVGKSSQNSSKPVLIFWSSIPLCILSLYTLLEVVRHYDLSVLAMSVMGFQKKVWMEGGWVASALSKLILDFWNFVNFESP